MDFAFNFYALFLILSGAVTLFLSYYVYRKDGQAVRFFAIMMLASAIWSIAYGFELASTTLKQAKALINLEYLGITGLPLTWFLFCLKLSGKEKWYQNRSSLIFLVGVPVITTLLVWTNHYHHLHYQDYYMDWSGDFPTLTLIKGPSYWFFTAYFYTLLAIGSFLLVTKFRKADRIYKSQNYSVIIAAAIPWLTNISYLIGLRPMKNLDLTPFAFIATIFLIFLAIYRFKLFDILPVAREKVLDLMQDGFMVLDNKKRVIDCNATLARYLPNAEKKRIIGASLDTILPGQLELLKFLDEHRSGKLELRLVNEKGTFDLEADVGYLDENQLNNEATIIKLQDLTKLRAESLHSKLQAEELKRLNDLKDRVFSIIAHDLRAPLVNLSEVLKMTVEDQISSEEFKALAPTLGKDIGYTTELLENILHWSRSQLKGYSLNRESFDLKELVANEIDYHMPLARAKNIEMIQDVFPGAMIFADVLMVQIVVRNILNNAIKFCNTGGSIEVSSVFAGQNQVRLCIADNGVGMSREVLKKLFSGENMSTRGTMNEKGTGLGMVVCKEFVEKNNGRLTVESEIGKGSRFCIYLPVDDKI